MGALVPAFLALVVLAGVPVLIHRYGRPRAERRSFAALRFLRRSQRETAPKRRLRELLLLIARAAVIALVPLLLAKPFFEAATDLPLAIGSGGPESAVLILDDSRSMGYRLGRQSRFELATRRAVALIDSLGRGSEAALLLLTQPAADLELTSDRTRLRQQLAAARPTHRPGDVHGAIRRATALLAGAAQSRRAIYLVSDLAAHGFATPSPPGEGLPRLVAIPIAPDEPRQNHAVIGLTVDPAPELGPRGVRIDATVASFGEAAEKELPITLRVDGKAVAKGLLELPPRGRAVKRFVHAFAEPAEGGSASLDQPPAHEVVVELPADALADDDRRFARVEVQRRIRVLLVDGDPRTIRRQDELYFLETALRPGDRDDSRIDVAVTTLDDLGGRRLDDYDAVFVANTRAPEARRAAALRTFVERGGGLFLALGDHVDPEAWNSAFGDLLPQPLQSLRTVGAIDSSRDDGEAAPGGLGERLGAFDPRHPILAPFAGAAGKSGAWGAAEALRETRVGRFVLLRPAPQAVERERRVLLRLDNGAPLLLERRFGAGNVLLLTTTVDRAWSDLALQPAFLPLMQQAARYLARAALREPEPPSLVGQIHEIPLGPGDRRLEVTVPGGTAHHLEADRVAGRSRFPFAATDEPGIYAVAIGVGSAAIAPRPSASFAVNVDTAESDLLPIAAAKLAELVATRPHHAPPPRRRIELWHALGAALLALLFVESLLAARRA